MAQVFKKKVKYETDSGLVGSVRIGRELAEASFNPEPTGATVLPQFYAHRTGRKIGLRPRHVKCFRVVRSGTPLAGEQRAYQDFVILTVDSLSAISEGSDIEVAGVTWSVSKRVNEVGL